MDTMRAEKRVEQMEKIEHLTRLPLAIKQKLTGRKDVSPLQGFGWQGTDL